MSMRMTGMFSGMDTESIIQELVSVKKTKVDTQKKAQTKLEWKQDAWKELNTKLKNLQSKYIANMRFSDAYSKKTTKVSNSSAVSVITGEGAVNGVQTLEVSRLAKTAYLTGGKIQSSKEVTALTTLGELDEKLGDDFSGTITVGAGDKQKTDAPVNSPDSTNVEKANYSSRIQFDDPELLTRSYEKATDAQKQKLDEIQARDTDSLGCFMVCVKDVMLAMGDLPEDTPYLTLEQVQAICDEVAQMGFRPVDFDDTEREVMTRFNAITGAPDYQGGSGITNTVYFLNAEHTEYVRVWRGTVRHYDSAGSETWLLRP